jgi:hypothetical protein
MKIIVRYVKNQGWIIVAESSVGVTIEKTVFNTKHEALAVAQQNNPGKKIEIQE